MGGAVACLALRQKHAVVIGGSAAGHAPARPTGAAAFPACTRLALPMLGDLLLPLRVLLLLLVLLLPLLLLLLLLTLLGVLLLRVVLVEDVQGARATDVPQPQLAVAAACRRGEGRQHHGG